MRKTKLKWTAWLVAIMAIVLSALSAILRTA